MRTEYVTQAWLVILLSICFGGALAGVHATLQDRIEQNRLDETLSQIPHLVPGADSGAPAQAGGRRVYRALSDDRQVGWVIPAGGQGFADRIDLLVGLNRDASRITGLYVLDQKETPGLGNRIVESDWREQFEGRPAETRLAVTKTPPATGDRILAVTGATISSESVCDIVNRTLAEVRPLLQQAAGKE